MRALAFLLSVFLASASVVQAAEGDDRAAVRKQTEQLTAVLLKGDQAGLEALIHKDYQARSLPGPRDLPVGGKTEGVRYWLGGKFLELKVEVNGIRLFGDTAVETGTLSAQLKELGTHSTWNELAYTRIWLRDGKNWRLVHEQF
jgi:hypothetical protein